MRTSARIASCLAVAGFVTALGGATSAYADTSAPWAPIAQLPFVALPCPPTVSGSGPTIFIDPDYQDPTQSTVGYDTSDFSVSVSDPCIH